MGRATGRNNPDLGVLQLLKGLAGTVGSAGRGLVAGTMGLPGDLESLARMLIPGVSNDSFLPTTERMDQALPQLPEGMRQPVAGALGQMGALTPGQAGKVLSAGKRGALALMDRAASPPRAIAQAGAVKPRGGNWLRSGGTEYIDELLQPYARRGNIYSQEQKDFEQVDPMMGALNNWIRGPMTKYVKRDLGTAEDPLLRLADEGISTLPKDQLLNPPFWAKTHARESRKASGLTQPELGGYAQGWSDLADGMVLPAEVGGIRTGYGQHWGGTPTPPDSPYWKDLVQREGEWLGKLPDDAKVHQFTGDEALGHLGFGELVQTLKHGLNAGDELPPGLRLKPQDMQQMGMEKAVRYMNDVENFKKVQAEREAARLAEQMGKQGKLVKEFPSGHRMVELSKPEAMDEQMMASIRQNADGSFSPLNADGKVIQRREMMDGNLTDVVEQNAEDAYLGGMLANEGNAMQHCVGGYCQDVSKGTHKIFSLRDAKGEPHTTIELAKQLDMQPEPPDFYSLLEKAPPDLQAELFKTHGLGKIGWLHAVQNDPRWVEYAKQFQPPPPPEKPWIVSQVYGKQNTALKEEYLPMIQDFIRGGGHTIDDSTVLKNSGLIPYKGGYVTKQELEPLLDVSKGPADYDAIDAGQTYVIDDGNIQFKDGGLIHGDDDFAMPGHF